MTKKDKQNKEKQKEMGGCNMESVIERTENYTIGEKLKLLSLKTKKRRLEMKQYDYIEKDSIVNKELSDIQQDIYNTIK